jgi:molybdopterin-guanine dinucleotide biosynthesis protein
MAIVVIGGHTRNIGKTSVVCSLIAALTERAWTAIKITQFGHNVCSANGEPCDCQTADHTIAISEERDPATGTDSSRYLAAGAARSLWVRTRQGQLAEAMPILRREIVRSSNVVIESNSVLRFLKPDVYAAVLDPGIADFKPSSLRYLDRADAILMPAGASHTPAWPGVSPALFAKVPTFLITPPIYFCPEFVSLVTEKLDGLGK